LEDGHDPDVQTWVARQNAHTRRALDADPHRAWWHERLVSLLRRPVVAGAELAGGRLFCLERPPGAEQFVLTVRTVGAAGDPVVVVDPTMGAADDAVAIDWFQPSLDGSLVAVGISEGGTEHSTLRVVAADTGADVGGPGDAIPSTRACSLAWDPDGTGFHYTRYPDGEEYHRTVHHHLLGADWRADPVVWADPAAPEAWPSVDASPDGRWLLVSVQRGWARLDVHLLDRSTGTWATVVEGEESTTHLSFGADGVSLVGVTTVGAAHGRVVRAPLEAPSVTGWSTLVPERDRVLGSFAIAGEELLVVSTRRATDVIERYAADGRPLGQVEGLDPMIAVAGLRADRTSGLAVAVIDSFDAPTATWGLRGGVASPWAPTPTGDAAVAAGDPPALTVAQVAYPSIDGTEIGLFLIHRSDVTPGADVPLILNGYGGFAISEVPSWSPQIGAWCAAGGVYAVAGLRGGAEEGEDWHHAGRRERKHNVFDDFHAGADWLVETGRASRERLAIVGRSNGGLLVGVALTQRPDLGRAVWCGVPLLDMIRYPQFLIARLWTSEYGDPEVAEEFAWLHAYSPYHHVVEGTCYPATLFTTAEGDSRVDPLHARKMAALLQAATSCPDERPILMYQEGRAGHGVGKPVHQRADELADGLSFLARHVGLVAS
jgi:prolyl oligopeptidase